MEVSIENPRLNLLCFISFRRNLFSRYDSYGSDLTIRSWLASLVLKTRISFKAMYALEEGEAF